VLLYIVRHGDPDYATDSLTERGILQAEAVGKRIRDSKIDRIFSSPMGRARQTAEPACRLLGLEYTVEEWTHEIGEERYTSFPDGKRKSVTLVQNTYLRENGAWDLPYSQGLQCQGFRDTKLAEYFPYIEENGKIFLEKLGYREENGNYRILYPNEERVALFCHAAFARAWLSMLLKIPVHTMWASFDYCHSGVTILNFRNYSNGWTAPQCLCYNDLSHLYAYGPAMLYNNKIEL